MHRNSLRGVPAVWRCNATESSLGIPSSRDQRQAHFDEIISVELQSLSRSSSFRREADDAATIESKMYAPAIETRVEEFRRHAG